MAMNIAVIDISPWYSDDFAARDGVCAAVAQASEQMAFW